MEGLRLPSLSYLPRPSGAMMVKSFEPRTVCTRCGLIGSAAARAELIGQAGTRPLPFCSRVSYS
jgi:hypothetical protein